MTRVLTFLVMLVLSECAFSADFIDKVYHPYVDWNTWSFETRLISSKEGDTGYLTDLFSLGLGKDISDKTKFEFYVIGEKGTNDFSSLNSVEAELLFQIGEQGEHWADFGIILEVERSNAEDAIEVGSGLIIEKEFGKWSNTLNAILKFEKAKGRNLKQKGNISFQSRYRHRREFEPGIEIFLADEKLALGPVLRGHLKNKSHQFKWELSFLKELKDGLNDKVVKALVEFEF